MALLAATPFAADTAFGQTDLPPIDVTTPRPGRPAVPPQPTQPPTDGEAPSGPTPLNTGTVAESASRLGLTVRQTPATVEVIDQETIREQGYRTTTEAAQGAVGVTAGDAPGAPAAFSIRGYSFSEINVLYNGIKIGPQSMTSRPMDAFHLEQVEFFKGPNSLMSGEGATGGAVNYVTKRPHTGKIENEAFVTYDSFDGYRAGFGSGGSTTVKGLDYRFDFSRSSLNSFIDDTYSRTWNLSTRLDYRVSEYFKVWGALEHKQDKNRFYWGTPLVPIAFSGPFATSGIVSGNWVSSYNGTNLGPVTIDSRTLKTTYNVLDNDSGARELWLRGGFDWAISSNVTLKSQVYAFDAKRHWFNNEVNAFNAVDGLVDRERFFVAHDQRVYGSVTDLTWNSNIAGMDNRFAAALAASTVDFEVSQAANFPFDQVELVNPVRGFYGPLVTNPRTTKLDNVALSFEDRLKVTRELALIGGIRFEYIELERDSKDVNGNTNPGFPFSKSWTPVTGRVGYTYEPVRGLTFYSQYATAADPAVANIFILRPNQPLVLTTSRIFETGVKHLLWDNTAEWSIALFDIERRNVFAARGGRLVEIAGKVASKGVELAAAVKPMDGWKLWGNIAVVDARYENFEFPGGSFTGNTPPNVPSLVANAGTSYRFATRWPVELGAVVRRVGDRFVFDDNAVTMLSYTVADAFASVDVDTRDLAWQGVDKARLTFRVRNLTDKKYAIWSDPGYPDQIILGAPRSFEVGASFKF